MANFSKAESKEYIFKELGKADKKERLFDTMKDVYMIAFLLGALDEEKEAIDKKSSDPIKEIYFTNEDKYLMDLVTLYITSDINKLDKSEKSINFIYDMVEQFTNSGISKLSDNLNNEHFNLDKLINSVKSLEYIKEPEKVGLDDLMATIIAE